MEDYLRSILVIAAVLGALGGVLWVIRTLGNRVGITDGFGQKKRKLRLEEHIALGPKRGACVVTYEDKKYLLGVTDQQVTLLSEIDNGPIVTSGNEGDTDLEMMEGY